MYMQFGGLVFAIIIIIIFFSENNTTQSLPSNEHNRKAAREARDSLTGRLCN